MGILEIVILSFLGLIMVIALGVLAYYGPGGGTYIKEDGTIIEWFDDGGGQVLRPDGKLEKYPAE